MLATIIDISAWRLLAKRSRTCRNANSSITDAARPVAIMHASTRNTKSMWTCELNSYARNPANTNSEPCARLSTSSVPHASDNPSANSVRTEPKTIALTSC